MIESDKRSPKIQAAAMEMIPVTQPFALETASFFTSSRPVLDLVASFPNRFLFVGDDLGSFYSNQR